MRKDWIRLPLEILQLKDLQPIDAIVFAILLDIADYTMGNPKAKCKRDYIANTASVSLRSVSDSLHRLSDAGLITDIIRTGKANIYSLQPDILTQKAKKQKKDKNYNNTSSFDLEEYKTLINDFD